MNRATISTSRTRFQLPSYRIFHTTDLQYNLSDEDLPESWVAENEQWQPPGGMLTTRNLIIEQLKTNDAKWASRNTKLELLAELEDYAAKISAAREVGDAFHFCAVM